MGFVGAKRRSRTLLRETRQQLLVELDVEGLNKKRRRWDLNP